MKPLIAPVSHFPLDLLASFHNDWRDQLFGHTIQNSSRVDILFKLALIVNEWLFCTVSWLHSVARSKRKVMRHWLKHIVKKYLKCWTLLKFFIISKKLLLWHHVSSDYTLSSTPLLRLYLDIALTPKQLIISIELNDKIIYSAMTLSK